ncbi:hypothetical protein E4U37_004491 [Claviceps purpurea]|nr:hypothetical protein E4U37_004491 [Claviceps purpurea]
MEQAATGQPSQESSREVAPGSIDPNLRAGESASLGTSHLPQPNPVSDWSQPRQALNSMSLSYYDIEEDFDTDGDLPIFFKSAPSSSRCIPDFLEGSERDSYLSRNYNMRHLLARAYLCTLDQTVVEPIALAPFEGSDPALILIQVRKCKIMKNTWKCNSIRVMEAFIDKCLDEVRDDQPTTSAALFAAATSRAVAKTLMESVFSLDRFEHVFRFVHYLNLADSNDRLRTWCQFIWGELGASVLLSQLRARNIDLDLDPEDEFAYTHDALRGRWRMYGDSPHLVDTRSTPRDIVMRQTRRTQVRQRKTKAASAHPDKNPFDMTGYI